MKDPRKNVGKELLLAIHEAFSEGRAMTVVQMVKRLGKWHRSQVARAISILLADEVIEVVNPVRANGSDPVIYQIRSTNSAPDVDNNPFLWRTFKQPFPVQGGW